MSHTVSNRWVPILRRDVYCSPACGCQCKHADYLRAVRDGDALAARMGEGWVSKVWENFGWHCKAVKGVASIHRNENRNTSPMEVTGYTLFFNIYPQIVTKGETPEEALEQAVQRVHEIQKGISKRLQELLHVDQGRPAKTSELHDADPNCAHRVVSAPGGGIKCLHCPGWFCY